MEDEVIVPAEEVAEEVAPEAPVEEESEAV